MESKGWLMEDVLMPDDQCGMQEKRMPDDR